MEVSPRCGFVELDSIVHLLRTLSRYTAHDFVFKISRSHALTFSHSHDLIVDSQFPKYKMHQPRWSN